MTLFKTSFLTGISTLIKTIATYVMWKIIAVYTGPTGVALIEQFQNFLQIARSAILCGINQAVIKYVAEYKTDGKKKSNILSNALIINLVFCIIIAAILILFSSAISNLILQSSEYKKIIILVAASIILFSMNIFGLSVLNGELEIKKYVICNIANTTINFLLTIYLVIYYGFYGGLIGFTLNQALVGIITVYFVMKCKEFNINSYLKGADLAGVSKIIKYSLMVFTVTLIVPISHIVVRKYIASTLLWEDAGYWQAIMRLSSGYLIVMNLILSIYYIPKFSGTKTILELKKEVIRSYKIILPLILIAIIMIFFLKKQITIIMYSSQFLPIVALFKYQLIGDTARMGTWLLTNILFAKAMIKTFIFSEIFFATSYVLFTIFFVHYYGLIGSAIGFAVNYILYAIFIVFFSIWYLNKEEIKVDV